MESPVPPLPQSAKVHLTLSAHGNAYTFADLGPNRVFRRTVVDRAPRKAELVISVNGRISRSQTQLPNDASARSQAFETI